LTNFILDAIMLILMVLWHNWIKIAVKAAPTTSGRGKFSGKQPEKGEIL